MSIGPSLTPERFAQVRAVFEAALERPPAERRAYAAGACAGDRALLGEVEGMLATGDTATKAEFQRAYRSN
jgi:hypothetical protein